MIFQLGVELAKGRSGEGLKSGPLGFAVILVLCVGCYFLFKSMSRHLKKVREEFPVDTAQAVAQAAPPPISGPAAARQAAAREAASEASAGRPEIKPAVAAASPGEQAEAQTTDGPPTGA